jgi:sugar lactone lactonase YvrE
MAISHASSIGGLEPWGHDLHRPECVIGTSDGGVYVSDWRGGVGVIHPNGAQEHWLSRSPAPKIQTNGFAIAADGSFLIANLGDAGGIWRLHRDGTLEPYLLEVDGVELPPANFVSLDLLGRTWISISTRQRPRQLAWRSGFGDGFVVLVDDRGARIVADGLHYTNEVRVSPAGDALYVVETFGRRVRRFPLTADGRLLAPETVLTIERGLPDGFAFDDAGGIWVTAVVSNSVLRLHEGRVETMIEDADEDYVAAIEREFRAGAMNPGGLGTIPHATLQHISSLTFAGPDQRTMFLGSLHATSVWRCRWSGRS